MGKKDILLGSLMGLAVGVRLAFPAFSETQLLAEFWWLWLAVLLVCFGIAVHDAADTTEKEGTNHE